MSDICNECKKPLCEAEHEGRVFAAGHWNVDICHGHSAQPTAQPVDLLTSFREAALPLMKWLNENVHPHHTAIVTPTSAELMEGRCSTGEVLDYVKD